MTTFRPAVDEAGEATTPPRPALRAPRLDAVTLTVLVAASALLIPARYTYPLMGAAGRPGVILGLGLLFWWGITRLIPSMAERRGNPVRRGVLVFFVTLLMAYGGGVARALPGVEFRGLDRALLIFASLVGVALVITDGVDSRHRLDQLLRRTVGLGALMALIGHIQFFLGTNFAESLRLPGMSLNNEFFEVDERNSFTRVNATATHPIEFGVMMGVLLPLALHYALHAERRRRPLAWAMVVLIGVAGPVSVSRSSVVAMGVGLAVMAVGWNARQRKLAVLIAIPGLLAMRSAVPGLLGTLRGLFSGWGEDSSITYRTNDYDRIFELVSDRFLFGRGPGTFIPSRYFVVDNQYLVSLVETGIVGFLGLVFLVASVIGACIGVRRRARDEETRHLALALVSAFAAGVVASGTYDSLAPAFGIFGAVLFVLFGAAGALWRLEREAAEEAASTAVVGAT